MTKRFFYRDPLESAYMAKHYGMRFVDEHSAITYSLKHNDCNPSTSKYIIHPDSLALLDPQIGDVVEMSLMTWDARKTGSFIPFRVTEKGWEAGHHIIQRGGRPYFWPESEEA